MYCLAEHTPKSAEGQYTKFCRLIARNFREGAKIILKLLFLIQRLNLGKKLKSTYQIDKNCQKSLKFDYGSTGKLQETLEKEQKLF